MESSTVAAPRVLVASCGHKGYLSPRDACAAIARGLACAGPGLAVETCPMADGGNGTIDALVSARGGRVVGVPVHDPLFRPREARMAICPGPPETAVIEIAEAAGSALLEPHERDTMVATSYGVGEMILAAAACGCRRAIVGLGGSIVSDMGLGMAQALGVRFVDASGSTLRPVRSLGFNALSMHDIKGIRFDDLRIAPGTLDVLVASDADIPLLGPGGQARTFGPQKGAGPGDIAHLEAGFANLRRVVLEAAGCDVDVPLAGAAGGLGAGLLAFLGATLVLGAKLVAHETGLRDKMHRHDVVIIGEGRLDPTTLLKKGPHFAGATAKELGKHVIAIVGTVSPGMHGSFYDAVFPCGEDVQEAALTKMKIENDLEEAGGRAARHITARHARGRAAGTTVG